MVNVPNKGYDSMNSKHCQMSNSYGIFDKCIGKYLGIIKFLRFVQLQNKKQCQTKKIKLMKKSVLKNIVNPGSASEMT